MKICTIVGARPQFIKSAMLSRAIQSSCSDIQEILIHTGQHYDKNMSDIFFEQMEIPVPDYNLSIGGGTHAEMTGMQLIAIEKTLLKEMPDLVVVYGDTNSTLAGALAAVKLHIPIAHIEAGLRSNNNNMPEEINRIIVDRISSMLFTPTENSKNNLLNEGMSRDIIHVTGDIMYDASLFYLPKATKPLWLDELDIQNKPFFLATLHRAENTDDPSKLNAILSGLNDTKVDTILPLHPRARAKITELNLQIGKLIHIVEPVGFFQMLWLEQNCNAIATDSGGVQKEAYFNQKKCITLREETEWTELVEQGVNVLVGANKEKITHELLLSIQDNELDFSKAIYGNGDAALKILNHLNT